MGVFYWHKQKAVDELLMNSIFNAPVDELGKQLKTALDRDTQMSLTGRSVVRFHISYQPGTIGIMVEDQFGSMSREKAVPYLAEESFLKRYRPAD